MKNKLTKYKKEEIIEILQKSKSFRDALIKFGYDSNGSGGYTTVKNALKLLEIDIPIKYVEERYKNIERDKIELSKILIINSTYPRSSLKKRLIKEKLLEYKCFECGNEGEWNGKKLSLQLEHKNGINNDNRLENLTFLCPNCHSQSHTYGGKNAKKIYKCSCGNKKTKNTNNCQKCSKIKQRKVENRPSYEILKSEIEKNGYCATGRKYGVSDNSIRKWIKYYEKN